MRKGTLFCPVGRRLVSCFRRQGYNASDASQLRCRQVAGGDVVDIHDVQTGLEDRLSLTNALADANIDRQKAERIATEIFDAIHDNVATKQDLQALEAKLELVKHQLITRLGGLVVVVAGLLFAALHYWPPHGWTPSAILTRFVPIEPASGLRFEISNRWRFASTADRDNIALCSAVRRTATLGTTRTPMSPNLERRSERGADNRPSSNRIPA